MHLKELAKMITKTEKCKEFCFGYAEIFLNVILKELMGEELSEDEIDGMATILNLGLRGNL